MNDFTPYGEEWERGMMKLPKKMIVDMFITIATQKPSSELLKLAYAFYHVLVARDGNDFCTGPLKEAIINETGLPFNEAMRKIANEK